MTQMGQPDVCAQVQAAAAGLFDGPVAVCVTDPRAPQPALLMAERGFVEHAVPARQNEFAAGRAMARAAMQALGLTPQPVLAASDRAPIWPAGVSGSITHTKTLCLAALCQGDASLGIDIEEDTPLNPALLNEICGPAEQAAIRGTDQAHLAKLIFCAKEAAYKAQYPITKQLFGFDHMHITLDLPRGGFVATFLKPAGRFAQGDRLPGHFAHVANHLVTAVTIGQFADKGA